MLEKKSEQEHVLEYGHSYYQGLIVEIGNLKNLTTFIPSQDKNKLFLNKPLKEIATTTECLPFSYEEIVKRARTVDVIWFNDRKMPGRLYEIEHSTDIQNSLTKFCDLQDFAAEFRIVADKHRHGEYERALRMAVFKSFAPRVKFITYETVSEMHTLAFKEVALNTKW